MMYDNNNINTVKCTHIVITSTYTQPAAAEQGHHVYACVRPYACVYNGVSVRVLCVCVCVRTSSVCVYFVWWITVTFVAAAVVRYVYHTLPVRRIPLPVRLVILQGRCVRVTCSWQCVCVCRWYRRLCYCGAVRACECVRVWVHGVVWARAAVAAVVVVCRGCARRGMGENARRRGDAGNIVLCHDDFAHHDYVVIVYDRFYGFPLGFFVHAVTSPIHDCRLLTRIGTKRATVSRAKLYLLRLVVGCMA